VYAWIVVYTTKGRELRVARSLASQ